MPIPRPDILSGPRRDAPQPMVRYCPTCKADLEVMASRRDNDHPHNYWCVACGRVFEVNYLGREATSALDQQWIDSVVGGG